ncbi:MAG TPA: UvrD-helicase domain-containing protein [Burkholderiaceae bacterium]|nr:UvrD-helicase domain-containing protein [Burkholderiaceae bacterium]
MKPAAYEQNGKLITPELFYSIACDPRRSVAVEACAGAGKTWMLVSRMLRVLLADETEAGACQPHEILAITFTKKAAGEMRQRLQEWLLDFSKRPTDDLEKELQKRGLTAIDAKNKSSQLRNLYASLLDKDRGVQIKTFHAWFASLLRNAPLSVFEKLNLPPVYTLLEDDKSAIAGVWRRFFAHLLTNVSAKADFDSLIAAYGRSQTLKALEEALMKRSEFELADAHGVVESSVPPFGIFVPDFKDVASPDDLLATMDAKDRWLARAKLLSVEKNKTPVKAAQEVVSAFECTDLAERFAILRNAFFIAVEDRLTHHLQKFPAAQEAEIELRVLCKAQAQHAAWIYQQRMTRLMRILIAEFTALKYERGWVDMNDVERAAQFMLSHSAMSAWMQERLDARVKHLMVDEFQDTSPMQWQTLYSWLAGYAGASQATPSVFIVGDPKQSIYRFRRAEPQVFIAAKQFVREGLLGDVLSCDHTRRNADEVLTAVNGAMLQAQDDNEYQGYRTHSTEAKHQGEVLSLPQIQRDAITKDKRKDKLADTHLSELVWRDSLSEPKILEEEKLNTLECRQAAQYIAQQIQNGTQPKEIMVLARQRVRLSQLLLELQALGIASEQPEKLELADAPEVQDVVALLDALVSPAHDLSLARALKSPIFGLDDDALISIALLKQGERAIDSWFDLLQNKEHVRQDICWIGAKLAIWKGLLETLPPHDALSVIYQDGDILARFVQSVPATRCEEVQINLQALLQAALDINTARYTTPYMFVRAMKSGRSDENRSDEISMVDATQTVMKPSNSNDHAIKLLTVHGAKGLEADLVLLLDTDALPKRSKTMSVLLDWPGEDTHPSRFVFMQSEKQPAPSVQAFFDIEKSARHREELNALYVAMTRAKKQLVFSSIVPHGDSGLTWWKRIQPYAKPIIPVDQLQTSLKQVADRQAIELLELPKFVAGITEQVSSELYLDGSDREQADPSVAQSARIGQAMHMLLQHLPLRHANESVSFDDVLIRSVQQEFELNRDEIKQSILMAHQIATGQGAWAWYGELIDWCSNEVEMIFNGQLIRIDRLVKRADTGQWWVLDYKSESQPQAKEELMAQMNVYRSAVQKNQIGDTVKAAFLTANGNLIEVHG